MLRRWRWEKLCRRAKTVPPLAPLARPGDDIVKGGALYVAALAKRDEARAALGLRALLADCDRAIGVSGVTSEGSSLRQRQLTLVFVESWLAARRSHRPEERQLAAMARKLLAALDAITLTGGLPEIGDAPDLGAASTTLLTNLSDDDSKALDRLRFDAHLDDLELLRHDGWLRLDRGAWSGLWYCPPSGWPPSGGLAQHDLGAAELHWHGLPLIVDAGSPPNDSNGLATLYRSSAMHSGISLDGRDPYPLDRPGYTDRFRGEIAGPPPTLRSVPDGVMLSMDGFGRFGGHRQIERRWRFDDNGMQIDDLVLGTGRPRIERRLLTPWSVSVDGDGVVLEKGIYRLRLTGDMPVTLHPARRWSLSGEEQALTLILFAEPANLPWRGKLVMQLAS